MLSIQNKRLGLLRLINWTQGNIQTYPWKWKTRWFDSGCWFSKVPIFRVRIWDQVAEFPAWNPTPKKVVWNFIISSFLLVNFNEKSPFKSSQNLWWFFGKIYLFRWWISHHFISFPHIFAHILSPFFFTSIMVNGPFRYLKLRYCTIFLAIFCRDIPLHRPEK